jgi:hypothetical protein
MLLYGLLFTSLSENITSALIVEQSAVYSLEPGYSARSAQSTVSIVQSLCACTVLLGRYSDGLLARWLEIDS